MEEILAEEELIITSTYPEWHLESDLEGIDYIIDFNKTKRIKFKMANGKIYYFSLVRVE